MKSFNFGWNYQSDPITFETVAGPLPFFSPPPILFDSAFKIRLIPKELIGHGLKGKPDYLEQLESISRQVH